MEISWNFVSPKKWEPGGGAFPAMHAPTPSLAHGPQPCMPPTPPVNRMTDASENITFPQLPLWSENIDVNQKSSFLRIFSKVMFSDVLYSRVIVVTELVVSGTKCTLLISKLFEISITEYVYDRRFDLYLCWRCFVDF